MDSHLLADPEGVARADAEREQMPAHYFAQRAPYEPGKGCAYRTRRGGVTCDKPFDHPNHLPPGRLP